MFVNTTSTAEAKNVYLEAIHHPIQVVNPGALVWSPKDMAMCRVGTWQGPELHAGRVKITFLNGSQLFFNPTDYIPTAPTMADLVATLADVWKKVSGK